MRGPTFVIISSITGSSELQEASWARRARWHGHGMRDYLVGGGVPVRPRERRHLLIFAEKKMVHGGPFRTVPADAGVLIVGYTPSLPVRA